MAGMKRHLIRCKRVLQVLEWSSFQWLVLAIGCMKMLSNAFEHSEHYVYTMTCTNILCIYYVYMQSYTTWIQQLMLTFIFITTLCNYYVQPVLLVAKLVYVLSGEWDCYFCMYIQCCSSEDVWNQLGCSKLFLLTDRSFLEYLCPLIRSIKKCAILLGIKPNKVLYGASGPWNQCGFQPCTYIILERYGFQSQQRIQTWFKDNY